MLQLISAGMSYALRKVQLLYERIAIYPSINLAPPPRGGYSHNHFVPSLGCGLTRSHFGAKRSAQPAT